MNAFDNQCDACQRKTAAAPGHCSLFLFRPTGPCGHHSNTVIRVAQLNQQTMRRMQPGADPAKGH